MVSIRFTADTLVTAFSKDAKIFLAILLQQLSLNVNAVFEWPSSWYEIVKMLTIETEVVDRFCYQGDTWVHQVEVVEQPLPQHVELLREKIRTSYHCCYQSVFLCKHVETSVLYARNVPLYTAEVWALKTTICIALKGMKGLC